MVMNRYEYTQTEAHALIINDLTLKEPQLKHAVSDICAGITHSNVTGLYFHDDEYWDEDVFAVEKEAFAHMFQAQFFPEQRVIMQRYFPRALAEFERLLFEVAK